MSLREEFEKIPKIKNKIISENVFWNESIGRYRQSKGSCRAATFLNGAWFMYQELNKPKPTVSHENEAYKLNNLG